MRVASRLRISPRRVARASAWLLLASVLHGPPPVAQEAGAVRRDTLVLSVRAVDRTGDLIPEAEGGARITIREILTGMVLAEGWQEGSPEPLPFHARFPRPAVPGPLELEVTAMGPLLHPQAMVQTSTTLQLAGEEVDALPPVVLTLRGLIVEVLAPPAPEPAGDDTLPGGQPLAVRAAIRLLGGRPAAVPAADGPLRVVARLEQGGEPLHQVPLEPTGEAGLFTGRIIPPASGQVDLVVEAVTSDGADAGTLRRHLYLRDATGERSTMPEP